MVGGPRSESRSQRLLGQVLEVQHADPGISGDPPGQTRQVSPVGGHRVGRRLGSPQLEEPAVNELAEA